MAAGDLVTKNGHYEFRGFLFGSGTRFIVEEVDGLHGMPDTEDTDAPFQFGHGSSPGFIRLTRRIFEIDMSIDSTGPDIHSDLNDLKQAFQVPRKRLTRTTEPFVWQKDGVKKRANARCHRRRVPSNYELAHGLGDVRLQLIAPDPIIYSNLEHSEGITIGASGTTASETVTNDGDFLDGYEPTIVVVGPFKNPRFTNQADDNRQIKVDVEATDSEILEINVKQKTVKINGVSVFTEVPDDNQWWSVVPGDNLITYDRADENNFASSEMIIRWRDTYS